MSGAHDTAGSRDHPAAEQSIDVICARVERLCLLQDLHAARRRHAASEKIERRLVLATARLAAMEAKLTG